MRAGVRERGCECILCHDCVSALTRVHLSNEQCAVRAHGRACTRVSGRACPIWNDVQGHLCRLRRSPDGANDNQRWPEVAPLKQRKCHGPAGIAAVRIALRPRPAARGPQPEHEQ